MSVFYSRNNPSAGVLAGGFERAAKGPQAPRVQAAARHWHAACAAVESSGLDPATATALAMRSAQHYGVGAAVEAGLGQTIGADNAAAATVAAEEGWADWAWRKAGDAQTAARQGIETVYTDARQGVQTVYGDLRQGGRNIVELPERVVPKIPDPKDWFEELKLPLTVAAAGATAVGVLYVLTRNG